MPGEHVFVDETKRGQYLVAAALVARRDLPQARATLRSLQLPGTRRVHFQSESDPYRRKFLAAVTELSMTARIYVCSDRRDLECRRKILRQLVVDLVDMGAERLILERDDSTVVHDERVIKEQRAQLCAADALRFDHLRSTEDPLLWLPDALAWAWTRDRSWRAIVEGMVTDLIRL